MPHRYLVTPSLYSSWNYYYNAEHTEKAEFLAKLQKVQEPRSENMQKGIDLENAAMIVSRGLPLVDDDPAWIECVTEIANEIKGGLFQEKVYTDIRIGDWDVLLYGKADCVRRDFVKDVKYTQNYDVGKYSDSIQHDLYLFCAKLPRFRYLISNGRSVWHEDYTQTLASIEMMRGRIYTMLYGIFADADFRAAYVANWTSRPQPVKVEA